MTMRIAPLALTAVAFLLVLAGCGKSPDEGAKQTRVKVEEPSVDGGLKPSGRPEAPLIDPQKKKVVVLAAPSAPQLASRQEAQLATEQDKTELQIHELMDSYSNNLGNPASKAKYEEQIGQQLETYKRQSLQLYKMQRQAQLAAREAAAATAN
jgi:hypothetical protein